MHAICKNFGYSKITIMPNISDHVKAGQMQDGQDRVVLRNFLGNLPDLDTVIVNYSVQ
jgi:hypothetical protein